MSKNSLRERFMDMSNDRKHDFMLDLAELFEWCSSHCEHCDKELPESERRVSGVCPSCGTMQTNTEDDIE